MVQTDVIAWQQCARTATADVTTHQIVLKAKIAPIEAQLAAK